MAVLSHRDRRRQVQAVLQEIVRGIDHLPRPVLHKIMPVLGQAQRELDDALTSWLRRQGGAERFTAQRYRNALRAVHEARSTIHRLQGTTEDALWLGATRAGQLATEHLETELIKFGHIFEGTIQPIAFDQAGVIAAGDRLLFKRFASSAARYAGDVEGDVIRELAVSRIRSETIFEATNRLERRLPEVFHGQRSAAARLAHTETMNAYAAFNQEGLRAINDDDPEMLARWDATFDSRRCPMCAALDGQVRNVAKGEQFEAAWTTATKKGLRHHSWHGDRPPGHPWCRCVLTPWRRDWPEYARLWNP